MAAIDPKGLFNGQRIGACSDKAQLYWPRLYIAANNFGRLEMHFPTLIERCFHSFREPPTEQELKAIIAEYIENFLAFPYPADGHVWLQFATEDKWLRHKKNAADYESPVPPPDFQKRFDDGYAEWKQKKATQNGQDLLVSEMFPKLFGNSSEKSPTEVFTKSSTALGIRHLALGIRGKEDDNTVAAANDASAKSRQKPDKGKSMSPLRSDSVVVDFLPTLKTKTHPARRKSS